MVSKVAVVTGSNRGIGYAIVRELCRRGVENVYLTSRDVKRGLEAVDNLNKENLKPLYHQLNVTDQNSVKAFAEYLKQKHGKLDILINNAGVIPSNPVETSYEDAIRVLDVNYYSIVTIQEYLFPILEENARVINISSDFGHIVYLKNTHWIKRLTKENVKLGDINAFVEWFLDSVKNGTLDEDNFLETTFLAYKISKIALCALTRVQQKEASRGISINSLHPGFVKTDITLNIGLITMEEASKAPVYLALDIAQSAKGKYFWFDKTEKDWTDLNHTLHSSYAEVEKRLEELRCALLTAAV